MAQKNQASLVPGGTPGACFLDRTLGGGEGSAAFFRIHDREHFQPRNLETVSGKCRDISEKNGRPAAPNGLIGRPLLKFSPGKGFWGHGVKKEKGNKKKTIKNSDQREPCL